MKHLRIISIIVLLKIINIYPQELPDAMPYSILQAKSTSKITVHQVFIFLKNNFHTGC
jgi:hypothetical protein